MPGGYQENAYTPKTKISVDEIGDGQIDTQKLSPGLFQQVSKITTHNHNGTDSIQLTEQALRDGTINSRKLSTSAITLGYEEATSSQGSITTETDLTGLSVTVLVPPGGRRLKITGYAPLLSSVGGDGAGLRIYESSTQLTKSDVLCQVVVARAICFYSTVASVGSHTYKLRAARVAGTGNITMNAAATDPAFILVELI